MLTFAWLITAASCGRVEIDPVTADNHVGEATCLGCHSEQASYLGTAHHLSSAAPTRETIHGSFQEGENVLRTSNPYLHYRMEDREDGFYQTAVLDREEDATTASERFGVVIGSGRKGQSYLYWRDGTLLYQLPVSYWTELGDWVHSPGYLDGVLNFGREVHPRCVECHSTYFASADTAEVGNQYDTATVILGITCEKCHGAGREHVDRQASSSLVRRLLGRRRIVNPARLSRERQIEGCGFCHGGAGEPIEPSFTYAPGDRLASYVNQPAPGPLESVDVHGNQVALLRRSPCFQASEMTCVTCHNVHDTQRDPAAFSATCLTCHQPQSCGLFPEHGFRLTENCVGCHMPELPSNTIISSHEGRRVRPMVRTHWIRVYRPDELREAKGVPNL